MKSRVKTLLLVAGLLIPGRTAPAAILYPAAPEGERVAAAQSLFQARKSFRVDRVEDLTIADPCEIYRENLAVLASGKWTPAAHLGYGCDWECLVMNGSKAEGLCFFWTDRVTAKVTNCLAAIDGVAGKWQEAINVAEQLPTARQHDYVIRFIEDALPQFKAVWLHGRSDDVFVPLYDAGGRLKALQTCTKGELLQAWQPMAHQQLKEPIPLD